MFTGIVETVAVVSKLEELDSSVSGGNAVSLTIENAKNVLEDCHEGDSISINGTCLTVTSFDTDSFKVGVSPETTRRTNLGHLKPGSKVNLERAVSCSSRMGGHMVQGHVDTVATIVRITKDGNALSMRFQPRDPTVLRYIVEKGFITIDGASLTVTAVEDGFKGWWEVMLIAYTQERVVTASKMEGDLVNVEVDMIGKYVEKNVMAWFESKSDGEGPALERLIARLVDQRMGKP